MRQIKSKNTKPEMLVRKFLHAQGFRFRLHVKDLPGKPDIVLPKFKVVVLVNGCFWHGHQNCSKAPLPKTNSLWWKEKIDRNISKDKANIEKLEAVGWRVITLWQCQLKESWNEDLIKFIQGTEVQVKKQVLLY